VFSQVTPPMLACCMISQHVQDVWSGAVCIQAELTNWQHVIPYVGTEKYNVFIIMSHD